MWKKSGQTLRWKNVSEKWEPHESEKKEGIMMMIFFLLFDYNVLFKDIAFFQYSYAHQIHLFCFWEKNYNIKNWKKTFK